MLDYFFQQYYSLQESSQEKKEVRETRSNNDGCCYSTCSINYLRYGSIVYHLFWLTCQSPNQFGNTIDVDSCNLRNNINDTGTLHRHQMEFQKPHKTYLHTKEEVDETRNDYLGNSTYSRNRLLHILLSLSCNYLLNKLVLNPSLVN